MLRIPAIFAGCAPRPGSGKIDQWGQTARKCRSDPLDRLQIPWFQENDPRFTHVIDACRKNGANAGQQGQAVQAAGIDGQGAGQDWPGGPGRGRRTGRFGQQFIQPKLFPPGTILANQDPLAQEMPPYHQDQDQSQADKGFPVILA